MINKQRIEEAALNYTAKSKQYTPAIPTRQTVMDEQLAAFLAGAKWAAQEYEKLMYVPGSIHEQGDIKREMTWKESSEMFESFAKRYSQEIKDNSENLRAKNKEIQQLNQRLEIAVEALSYLRMSTFAGSVWKQVAHEALTKISTESDKTT